MSHVALSIRDRYLHVAERNDETVVRADAADVDEATVLTKVPLGHDRIALRTMDGAYLAIRPEGRMSFALTLQSDLTADAAFEEVLWPDGRVSLRTSQLTYVTAHLDGSVVANRTLTGRGERFTVEPAPAGKVPSQLRRHVTTEEPVLPSAR
jgi:hypothetical protein